MGMLCRVKVILATGIYPPEIGGPATYVRALAEQLSAAGCEVIVVTYGDRVENEKWKVEKVSPAVPILRWWRYARVLRKVAADADVVEAFSSVSVGVPLLIWKYCLSLGCARDKPKLVLRLGGDFFWERYTDRGGMLGLRRWYERKKSWQFAVSSLLLRSFDHVIFSTRFQEELYERHYQVLPEHSVIENAFPDGMPLLHERHDPLRLLFVGRFVGFKNLLALIRAMTGLPNAVLTLAGSGPMEQPLRSLTQRYGLESRVAFLAVQGTEARQQLFASHDLLVLPSVTEISPNVALEARVVGLPVLLTRETGLSEKLSSGMLLRDLSTPDAIIQTVIDVQRNYAAIAHSAAAAIPKRSWRDVAEEHLTLFHAL